MFCGSRRLEAEAGTLWRCLLGIRNCSGWKFQWQKVLSGQNTCLVNLDLTDLLVIEPGWQNYWVHFQAEPPGWEAGSRVLRFH